MNTSKINIAIVFLFNKEVVAFFIGLLPMIAHNHGLSYWIGFPACFVVGFIINYLVAQIQTKMYIEMLEQ